MEQLADPPNPTRRLLLFGLVSAYTASLIPWALAQDGFVATIVRKRKPVRSDGD